VSPRSTSTAIRVLKALPTISEHTNPPTNGSMYHIRTPIRRGLFFSLDGGYFVPIRVRLHQAGLTRQYLGTPRSDQS
jgi:hypothetical protein